MGDEVHARDVPTSSNPRPDLAAPVPHRPSSEDQPGAAHRARHGAGSWLVVGVFAAAMAFSTVPAPLYGYYRERDGFSTFMITVIFAAYGVGVVASLFLAGHTSDWFGRRRLIWAALAAETVAAVVFLLWPALPGLLVARVLTGVGVGLVTATATAHVGELQAVARPGEGRTRADRMAVLANLGGLALGPLVAGLFAQYVAHPLTVPYLVFLVVFLLAAVLVLAVPETVDLSAPRPRYRPQRVSIPAAGRPWYYAAMVAAFAAFSILGLFTSVASGFIAGTLHHGSPLLSGSVTFVVFGAAATSQLAAGALGSDRQLRVGLGLVAVGVLALTWGVWSSSLALFVAGGVVAGAGAGMSFKGALSTAAGLAQPESRSEAVAGLLLVAFVGLVVPVVGIGVATLGVSLPTALLGFAIGLLLVLTALTARLRSLGATPQDA